MHCMQHIDYRKLYVRACVLACMRARARACVRACVRDAIETCDAIIYYYYYYFIFIFFMTEKCEAAGKKCEAGKHWYYIHIIIICVFYAVSFYISC